MNLAEFVKRLDDLHKTSRYECLSRWGRYYDGTQFDDREYDEHGCYPGTFGITGGPDMFVPWHMRRVRGVVNVPADIARKLAEWAVVGTSWCQLSVVGDSDATEWLDGLATESQLAFAVGNATQTAGGCGGAVVSATWRKGRAAYEVHRPQDCWVLRWVDARELEPLEVVKVYKAPDPFAPCTGEDKRPWIVRHWTGPEKDETTGRLSGQGFEAYYQAEKNREGEWVLRLISKAAHNADRCPVFWLTNTPRREEFGEDGEPDYAGQEGAIDEINELMQAARNTTKRNADDTLVVKQKPSDAPNVLRKGALGAIFAEGGAEYLSQDGDSARILLEVVKECEAQVYRRCGVVKAELKDLASQTSAAALERIYADQINKADEKRRQVERYLIRPLVLWLLRTSRAMVSAGQRVEIPPIEDEAPAPQPRPPGEPKPAEPDEDEGAQAQPKEKVVRERKPGEGESIEVTWPEPFPPTIDDLKIATEVVKNATGGSRAMSPETAVKTLVKAGAPVGNVQAELAKINEASSTEAEHQAKSLGLQAAETAPFEKAGPVA